MSKFAKSLLCLVACSRLAVADAPARVEPPSWWTGFAESRLQLMLYDEDIARYVASVDHPGVRLERSVRTANPNYLFLYLDIGADARAGDVAIELRAGDETRHWRYPLLARNADPGHARGFTSADTIYLITPDRFANGDPGNDDVPGLGDPADRADPTGRHGGDIAGIRERLDYIDDMGFTAIWLNPVLENAMPRVSYHGYSTTDFYRVDPRFGSNADYRDLVADAKSRGIGTIMDMIVNHVGSEHWWLADLPAPDWINHAGDPVITTHERTVLQDPYAAEADIRAFADGWFVTSMPDLNQRNPLLADYLVQNALWWIEYLGLAGIRMDTWPYPDKAFMADWTRRVLREYPRFGIVGEEWSVNPAVVAYWQRGETRHDGYRPALPSLMDFPLQDALRRALTADDQPQPGGLIELYRMLANDALYPDPDALVIFPDNHDMSRIYTQLGEDFDLWRMAMVYLLTMRGAPQIYYGTEILMTNPGTDEHGVIRGDFPGGWPGDAADAFAGSGLTAEQRAAQSLLRRLLNWRRDSAAAQRGELTQFVPRDGVYLYCRAAGSDRILVVINRSRTPARLDPGRFAEVLAGARASVDVLTGNRIALDGPFAVPARGTLLLELER